MRKKLPIDDEIYQLLPMEIMTVFCEVETQSATNYKEEQYITSHYHVIVRDVQDANKEEARTYKVALHEALLCPGSLHLLQLTVLLSGSTVLVSSGFSSICDSEGQGGNTSAVSDSPSSSTGAPIPGIGFTDTEYVEQ